MASQPKISSKFSKATATLDSPIVSAHIASKIEDEIDTSSISHHLRDNEVMRISRSRNIVFFETRSRGSEEFVAWGPAYFATSKLAPSAPSDSKQVPLLCRRQADGSLDISNSKMPNVATPYRLGLAGGRLASAIVASDRQTEIIYRGHRAIAGASGEDQSYRRSRSLSRSRRQQIEIYTNVPLKRLLLESMLEISKEVPEFFLYLQQTMMLAESFFLLLVEKSLIPEAQAERIYDRFDKLKARADRSPHVDERRTAFDMALTLLLKHVLPAEISADHCKACRVAANTANAAN